MGRAADAINQLQGTISSLQSQIATLQAQPTEDAADIAAINGVLGAPVNGTQVASNAGSGTVPLANSNTPSGDTSPTDPGTANASGGTPAANS